MENLETYILTTTPHFLRKAIGDARRSFIRTETGQRNNNTRTEITHFDDTMEQSQSLTLNEDALKQLPEPKRSVFIFEWLSYLEKSLLVVERNEIKNHQKKLVQQLTAQINGSPGPPTRKLLASCLATLFSVGDTFMLFDTANICNDILKNKDDSPSYLPTKLAAICVLGSMYEKLGRMMGRSYEETVNLLLRTLRNAESQARIEIMITLEKVCAGMGTAISNVHKDIYKATKHGLTDRVMAVRVAAAKCILEMIQHAPFLYQTELENLPALCFRAFDGSSYEVRCAVAKLLGTLLAFTQQQQNDVNNKKMSVQTTQSKASTRQVSLDETLNFLMTGFLRGGGSFLKGTGEIIKGSSSVNREIRVGVTHAYVVFVDYMGSVWLERNLSIFLSHVLDLVANPKAASSHVDAVYSRKCINFVLRSVLGKMLGEKAQTSACKELIYMIAKQMNSIDFNPENAKDSNQETLFSQHFLVCALQELGSLVLGLGTTAQNLLADQTLNAIDTTCAVLVHPSAAARLAAAWCLRCFCVAVPSLITPLIDRFVDAIEQMRSSPEAVAGYSCALAAILGSVRYSPLGIPHTKGKVVFNAAEELLRSASQNSRMSLNRTQAGWLLIGSIMTLGSPVVKGLLPRLLLLWRHSFPRSNKELESEKARGDSFTWQVTLEGRAGALSVMHSFLVNCPDLVTEDITKRLLTPIESALAMLVNLSSVLKSYGTQLKAPAAMVRLRLYETLSQLPSNSLEASYTHLLRMLISEFTLAENPANTTNSLLRNLCHADDSVILGTWLQETDHRIIEDQMEPNRRWDGDHLQPNSAAGSGALEHDPCCLYRVGGNSSNGATMNGAYGNKADQCPGPLPLGVAIIDMSITLFGVIFPKVANKHRLQMLDHFGECIRQAKSSRQEAVQMNVYTALLCGLKVLTDNKASIGQEDVRKNFTNLVTSGLNSSNSMLRCASAEALGRLAQVVGESRFTAELAQNSFDKLKSARDVVTRTGHSLSLGCLHRYVGGMGSSQHLNTSVSILLALAQDISSPIVQLWALHALALIADSGGPMFRSYVEATLTLCMKLLLNVPQSFVDVHQCIGRVLNALITTMGPELQGNVGSITKMRKTFICAAYIMQGHSNPLVQAEATGCLQQVHLFAPGSISLPSLVPTLVKNLSSNYLTQRKASVSCLRQLAHREAKEVCDLALAIKPDDCPKLVVTEYGLPGILFAMLDSETDIEMLKNIHDTLTSMLQLMAAESLSTWLSLCKNVLTVAVENSPLPDDVALTSKGDGTKTAPTSSSSISQNLASNDQDDEDEEDDADDVTEYHATENSSTHPAIQPRWTTRVFAAQSVRKIMSACEFDSPVHFDLLQAKEMQMTKSSGDYLILHLSELIRMSFIAATSDSDQLRLEGLRTLQEIIDRFANVPEPEFPGHLLLEQFQAQVGAALRPAFAPDTPSHVTAAACEVCSAWIGSGVARDLNDLRRVHQLLVSSLNKLHTKTNSTQLFNESMTTLEKLSILKAWAEVYIVAMITNNTAPASLLRKQLTASNLITSLTSDIEIDEDETMEADSGIDRNCESLLTLVKPELDNLSTHWLAAMKDHALLLLPAEFQSQLPHDGGAFYTPDTINSSKPHYLASWPPILYAASLWLKDEGFQLHMDSPSQPDNELNNTDNTSLEANNNISHGSLSADRFHMIFGLCMEALCSTRTSEKPKNVISCLQSMYTIFDSKWARQQLVKDKVLTIELCNVLHRQILTSDDLFVQLLCIEILKQSVQASKEQLAEYCNNYLEKHKNIENADNISLQDQIDQMGEGGSSGEITPGSSHIYAVLEVCLCLFVRQIPTMNPGAANTVQFRQDLIAKTALSSQSFFNKLAEDNGRLVASALECVEELTTLCSPKGALAILPTILYMTTSIIKEIANKSFIDSTILANTVAIQAALHALESICKDKWAKHPSVASEWQELLQSSLATIVDLTKTAGNNEDRKMDEVTMLKAIAVFILHTPPAVVSTPSLQYPCINHFRQYLQSDNLSVKLKCIQTARLIFSQSELKVSTPYIHALAPRIIEGLYMESAKQPKTELELQIILESIVTVEALIELAEPQNRNLMQGIQMLTLLVPVLINYLAEPSKLRNLPKYQRQLHEQALQWLMKIGPKYPQEFKSLMGQSPELRQKLEAAVRCQQQSVAIANRVQTAQSRSSLDKQQKPTIKLKTDFSNFQ